MPIIIGIDPGTNYTGWGVIDSSNITYIASDVIKSDLKQSFEDKIHNIYLQLTSIIQEYSPSTCAIEKIFINKNPKSSITLAQTRGALLLTAKIEKLDIMQYDATSIKKSITGNGHATKEQVKFIVNSILSLNLCNNNHDMWDALAIAICCAHHCH